jgi:hypothetical protein
MEGLVPDNTEINQQRLAAIIDRLDAYRRKYEAAHDSRAIFTCAYANLTLILKDGVAKEVFIEPDWVVSLAEIFAGYYTDALDGRDQGREVSKAWEKVFDTLRIPTTSVIEDLVFAMTAHIVHDLPFALVRAGLSTDKQFSCIRDFHFINDVLGESVKIVEDRVLTRYAPFLKWLDQLEKGYDLILSNYGFRLSRGIAWYNANRLLDPNSRLEAEEAITKSTITLIDNVRNPPIVSVRIFFWFARFIVGLLRRWPTDNV